MSIMINEMRRRLEVLDEKIEMKEKIEVIDKEKIENGETEELLVRPKAVMFVPSTENSQLARK